MERARWSLADDVPWDRFDPAALTDEQALTVKHERHHRVVRAPRHGDVPARQPRTTATSRLSCRSGSTRSRSTRSCSWSTCAASAPSSCPTEEELHAVRFQFDPAPPLETLMLHFCGEVRLTRGTGARPSGTPSRCSGTSTASSPRTRRATAARTSSTCSARSSARATRRARPSRSIGVLMASGGRGGKPLHPTNLHVNKAALPERHGAEPAPRPGLARRWLDEQIRFDEECEERVVRAILRSLSALLRRDVRRASAT